MASLIYLPVRVLERFFFLAAGICLDYNQDLLDTQKLLSVLLSALSYAFDSAGSLRPEPLAQSFTSYPVIWNLPTSGSCLPAQILTFNFLSLSIGIYAFEVSIFTST